MTLADTILESLPNGLKKLHFRSGSAGFFDRYAPEALAEELRNEGIAVNDDGFHQYYLTNHPELGEGTITLRKGLGDFDFPYPAKRVTYGMDAEGLGAVIWDTAVTPPAPDLECVPGTAFMITYNERYEGEAHRMAHALMETMR